MGMMNGKVPNGFKEEGYVEKIIKKEAGIPTKMTFKHKADYSPGATRGTPDKFFGIVPRDANFCSLNFNPIYLRVIYKDGVEVEPDVKFSSVTLSGNQKIFRNQSGDQDSFNITVLLHRNDMITGFTGDRDEDMLSTSEAIDATRINSRYQQVSLLDALDYWIREGTPFYLASWALDLQNTTELWLVTKNKKRKQTHWDYVEWDLEFTKYKKVNIGNVVKNTAGVDRALKQHEKNKSKVKSKTGLKGQLRKCKTSTIVYSKTKKDVKCVRIMQNILYNVGCFDKKMKKSECIDGWFGKDTQNALKNYQKKHKDDYGCKETGKLDTPTWKALCGYQKLKTVKTTDIEKDAKAAGASLTQQIKEGKMGIVTVKSKTTDTKKNSGGKKTGKKTNDPKKTDSQKGTTKTKKNGTTVKTQKGKAKTVTTKSGKNVLAVDAQKGKGKKGGKKK